VLREYGIVVDDDIVIDEASHFWADVSSRPSATTTAIKSRETCR